MFSNPSQQLFWGRSMSDIAEQCYMLTIECRFIETVVVNPHLCCCVLCFLRQLLFMSRIAAAFRSLCDQISAVLGMVWRIPLGPWARRVKKKRVADPADEDEQLCRRTWHRVGSCYTWWHQCGFLASDKDLLLKGWAKRDLLSLTCCWWVSTAVQLLPSDLERLVWRKKVLFLNPYLGIYSTSVSFCMVNEVCFLQLP